MIRKVVLAAFSFLSLCPPALADDFSITGQTVAADQAVAQVCVEMNAPVMRSADIPLDRFVSVSPAMKQMAVAARDGKLCIEGFAHGQGYDITLRKGLSGKNGVLAADAKVSAFIPDRDPSVSFMGRGYVLPRIGSEGLPVRTINVPKVQVKIARIHDRNMLESIGRSRRGDTLSNYSFPDVADQAGEPVWAGTLDTKGGRNAEVVTALPVAKLAGELAPGLYVAVASQAKDDGNESWIDFATQWFVVSDLALTAFKGSDGLTVAVRSLETAKPVPDVELALVSRNNKELVRRKTGRDGIARFDAGLVRGKGGNAPQAVYAYGESGDFVFLDFAANPVDLSDRGDAGRPAPGALDPFVYTDRGAYRPGETIHMVVLLRDGAARAVSGVPLTVKLRRPDDSEADSVILKPQQAGSAAADFILPETAMTGTWNIAVHADSKAPALAQVALLVEDFVPPRIEFDLAADVPALVPGAPANADIAARFLYGAPGAGLSGDVAMVVQVAKEPFPQFDGYSFGLVQQETLPVNADSAAFATGDDGKARVLLALPGLPDTTHPLEAALKATVNDVGGRAVYRELTLPIRSQPLYLGLRSGFDGALAEGKAPEFSAIALDGEGHALAGKSLRWELIREDWNYYWFQEYGTWKAKSVVLDSPVSSGKWTSAAEASAIAPGVLPAGQYRLEIFDPSSAAATSQRFSIGWWFGGEAKDTPDNVRIVPPATAVKAGEDAEVFITPPFESDVMVTVAGAKLGEITSIHLGEKGGSVKLPMPADETAGVYVLATAVSKPDHKRSYIPRRAVGLAFIPFDNESRRLEVALALPELARPETTLPVPVSISGSSAGDDVFLTVAGVDDGVLQLTGYTPPDPFAYYFGQRRLAASLFDFYGQLIDPRGAVAGDTESGGDFAKSMQRQMGAMPEKNTKVVALFSGIVSVDGNGKASVPLALPAWNGRLHVMAVAFSASRVGSSHGSVAVRPPVVADLVLPRFLGLGDHAGAVLSLHNVEGPAGDFTINMSASSGVSLSNGKRTETIAVGERRDIPVSLVGEKLGVGKISLVVKGPGGFTLSRERILAVLPSASHVTKTEFIVLPPGKEWRFDPAALSGMLPETAKASVAIGSLPEFGLAALVKDMQEYPYGCAEQTSSRLRVLLALDALGLPVPDTRGNEVNSLIRRLSGMQGFGGGFSAWGNGSRDGFITAQVMDVLLEARDRGFNVPKPVLDAGFRALREITSENDPAIASMPAITHAAYVLARAGDTDIFSLRYLRDRVKGRLPTTLAQAELGAAFTLAGDKAAAADMFRNMTTKRQETGKGDYSDWFLHDYGSELRDAAAVAAMALRAGQPMDTVMGFVEKASREAAARPWKSTQEEMWLITMAEGLMKEQGAMSLAVDGENVEAKTPVFRDIPKTGMRVENRGRKQAYLAATVEGIPVATPKAESQGYSIRRQVFNRTGKEVANLSAIARNTQLVVLLSGKFDAAGNPDTLLVDMLPAGFEIVPSGLLQGTVPAELSWLGPVQSPQHADARDDRYLAALYGNSEPFRVAYLVRATTPGDYTWPGVHVEDMYQPRHFATGDPAHVRIVEK